MLDKIEQLEQKIKELENRLRETDYNTRKLVQSSIKKNWQVPAQSQAIFGIRLGLCVDTKDPLGEGRVRFFNPAMHERDAPITSLPWAKPIANFGGFDDSGNAWVPPAGSTVAVVFENGDRDSPFYMGTIWTRKKGDVPGYWGRPVPEYEKYHQGKRVGYLVGENDDTENLPPWNTESYNNFDFDSETDFENDPEAKKKITIPNIYGIKTPQKHRLKMVDGNYDCNHRHKRVELISSEGIGLIFKDDHLHPFGQWANPKCGCGGGDISSCTDEQGNPIEKAECVTDIDNQPKCANKYYKRQEECVMVNGPGTPQNNKIRLPQSGFAFFSKSGNMFLADDSVLEPTGKPGWERATKPFDYGCKDTFKGKMFIQSAHGQLIELSDDESDPTVRSDKNRILLKSTTGNRLELNDHTLSGNRAGDKRGVFLESSSTHLLEMVDNGNEHQVPVRMEGGTPIPKSRQAYVRLKSGYGLQILLRDDSSQEATENQFIEIMAPQKDNPRGPHIFRMQERKDNEGLVFLRAAGIFVGMSTDDWVEQVGEDQYKPAFKLTAVKGTTVIDSELIYFNHSQLAVLFAESYIILAAGRDCPQPDGTLGPCIYPVIVAKDPKVCPFTGFVHWAEKSISDRVFASCSQT